MILNAHVRPVRTSDHGTMAEETARIRWPRIASDMVDDVKRTIWEEDVLSSMAEEGAGVVRGLEALKDDIVSDMPLTELSGTLNPDVQWFNNYIRSSDKISWLDAPWLFAECYLYRRVHSIFLETNYWKNYDVFERQKKSTFIKSQVAVLELALRYASTGANLEDCDLDPEQQFLLFSEMTQVALWGNATDLSLLTHLSLEELQSLQGRESIRKSQHNIVDNDLQEAWSYLNSAEYLQSGRQVDIVLDNSGFELFTDLVFAAYLLEQKIAKEIRLHVKDFPWFVSDATRSDVEWLLDALKSTEYFPTRAGIDSLHSCLVGLFGSGKIDIISNWFWTTGSSYHEMHERAPALLADLKTRDLVIFKGDLHYRKLTNDALWPYLTSFQEALGPLGNETGLRVLSLRTNKADVCVGLESEQQLEELESACPNGTWVRNGKYAVASFRKND
ncbi:uncharacterized protein HMPREF1541_01956 [Cyphellophora europaea CBS 101466]|uniref:Sugar phosphate phosphatase n=1 Tax=Cyphellophora europaea (strain CBS 101466) TaxID=1220924 RepID=W2S419_CYPE1|nr:uncharacterized protein HMPREF1541_01956 [Cyphellophora europaea CBS 101466]ETN42798.1 hypothetical protein HMPREF1541_01956 [Cyphellophora europaea CBS 101466]